jgi:hypothetical protein
LKFEADKGSTLEIQFWGFVFRGHNMAKILNFQYKAWWYSNDQNFQAGKVPTL